MEHIYAPWRYEYVSNKKDDDCPFCKKVNDCSDNDVIYCDELCYVVINKYPYSVGHIMVIPYHHTDKLEDLDNETWIRVTLLAQKAVFMLKDLLNAEGVNMGMNLGASAGAGIAKHIHLHLVPRWSGDTNFITTIANVRVYPKDFEIIRKKLKDSALKYLKIDKEI